MFVVISAVNGVVGDEGWDGGGHEVETVVEVFDFVLELEVFLDGVDREIEDLVFSGFADGRVVLDRLSGGGEGFCEC